MRKIAIVGGGVGGMAAAYDLARSGNEVTIFEASSHLGGLAAGFKRSNWQWAVEEFYHHWFQTDHAILNLMAETGLSKNVRFFSPKTVVYFKENFYPLDSPLSAITFPGFSLLDKARFGFITLYLKYLSSWKPFEKYTAYEWLQKYYGKNIFQTQYEPLLQGKFGQYYQQVNMAWFWARFKARTTKLGTYIGGFQTFIDDFSNVLANSGVQINLITPAISIQPTAKGNLSLITSDSEKKFDQILVTTSPQLFARMAPALDQGYLNNLLEMKSMGAIVLIFSLKNQLSTRGYYWFNLPKSMGFPFLALVEHTNFVSPEYFGGEHIIYCGDYLDSQHEHFNLSQDQLIEKFIPTLKRINPLFEKEWINESWLFRVPYAQPVPLINHSANIPSIQTPIANLFFASMSQIYPWDRGTNYAVELCRRTAKLMMS